MANCNYPDDQPTLRRSLQPHDAGQPLVESSAQHGAGMAIQSQVGAAVSQSFASSDQNDMADCSESYGQGTSGQIEASCQETRVVSVGRAEAIDRLASEAAPAYHGLFGVVNVSNVLKLLKHQNSRCALTGRPLTPETAALDHILPLSRGGEDRIENAQVLHKIVNRAKGTLTNEEFIDLCRKVVRNTQNVITKSTTQNREESHAVAD